jgi:hypothetical protein
MKQLSLFDEDISTLDEEFLSSDIGEGLISDNTKICRICNQEKSLDEFHLDRGSPYSKCKECFSDYQKTLRKIKKTAPAKPADGKCECCGRTVNKWVCDHHPNTEIFRGWVCGDCNVSSGLMGDTYHGAIKLTNYLYKRRLDN